MGNLVDSYGEGDLSSKLSPMARIYTKKGDEALEHLNCPVDLPFTLALTQTVEGRGAAQWRGRRYGRV